MRQAHRFSGRGKPYDGLTKMTKGGPVWTGKVALRPELLEWPLKWRRPRRIFVNSMSDLFHEDVHGDFIDAVLDTIKAAPQHTFQVLTKRAVRMQAFMRHYKPIANLWLGVSVEDQARADERIPLLLQTPAAVRWISAEPLIGPVNLQGISSTPACFNALLPGRYRRLDWVVAGGESGPGARPMHPTWARSLRDQCAAAGVPFFFKQWGAWLPEDQEESGQFEPDEEHLHFWPEKWASIHVGKKSAGRVLDGRTHDEYPA